MTPEQIEANKGKIFRKYCVNCGQWFCCKGDCLIRYKVLQTDSACFCPKCGLEAGFHQDKCETNCESRFGMNSVNPTRRDGISK